MGETLAVTGSGTVTSQSVGTGKTVTSVNLALTNGTGTASNYSINSLTADITGRPVSISCLVYDSTVTADFYSNNYIGVSGENLSLTGLSFRCCKCRVSNNHK